MMSGPGRRILVTGSEGFVGRHLVPALRARGHEPVSCPGPRSTGGLDVREPAAVRSRVAASKPDAVVHLAGITHLPKVLADPALALAVNVTGTLNVLDAVRAEAPRARVLLVSSAAAYGSPKPGSLPVDESTPLLAEHPYGVQKIAVECLGTRFREDHGLDVVIVRPFNHLGPGQESRFAASRFAIEIARMEAGLAPAVLKVGNLEPKRDLLDVRDVIRAYLGLIEPGAPSGVFNVASGTSYPIGWVLDWFLERASIPIKVESDQSLFRPMDAPDLRGSSQKLAEATGWKPEIPIEETLGAILVDARIKARQDKGSRRA